jgi:3-carboxy-cis,cis-muconate cycloisomerase
MDVQTDSGVLSPVRAGTRAEEAVCDRAWLQAMLDAEAALARAQAGLGTLPASAAKAITAAADASRFDLRELAVQSRETANPVVGLVRELTREVAEHDRAAAEYVHRGSTSQDVLDTGMMLVTQRTLRLIQADLDRAAVALAALAERHRDTTMAGRTLALHAVPTTFGLKAAGWRQLVLDARTRITRILDEGLPVSLGGAAGTLAGYLEYAKIAKAGTKRVGARPDRDPGDNAFDPDDDTFDPGDYAERLIAAFAEETGLAKPALPWHALRTPVADTAAALAFTTAALGKIAIDVQNLARTETGETTEPSAAGRGASSAMPQKRNPVLATLIRISALQVPVLATGVTQCLLAEDERSAGAWHAEWQLLRECLRLTGGAAHTAADLAEGLSVHEDRMSENLALTDGQIVSERIVAALAPKLGKTAAKELLTSVIGRSGETNRPLHDLLAETPEIDGYLTRDELVNLCDPNSYRGAAGPMVDQALRG